MDSGMGERDGIKEASLGGVVTWRGEEVGRGGVVQRWNGVCGGSVGTCGACWDSEAAASDVGGKGIGEEEFMLFSNAVRNFRTGLSSSLHLLMSSKCSRMKASFSC